MNKLDFLLIDVFTDHPFGGSRLTVFPDGDDVPSWLMHKLAQEMGPGEAAFVLAGGPAERDGAGLRVFTPQVEIPFAGPVSGLGALFSLVSILFMLGLSVFLMMPVAALFAGLMIEDVAEATEAAAGLAPPAPPRPPLYQSVVDSVNFVAVLMLVNLLAVLLYAAIGWFAPLAFWALNGYLLGREYFTLIARRRLGREAAKALRRRHRGTVWLAGMAMAGPLSVPLVNLVIPALGAATFTHLFHRLQDRPPGA